MKSKGKVFVGMSPKQTLRVATGQAGVASSRKRKLVFVGMSGGVDSSVSAALLKEAGFEVVGVHLKCFNVDGCAAQDAEDARRAAEHLKIPFYTFDYEQAYKDKVVEYMIQGYKKGITPNPDVMCNKEIKFGLFYKKAMEMGADYVATGHYVRLVTSDKRQGTSKNRKAKSLSPVAGNLLLRVAADANKDQSYFLWAIPKEELAHCLFPIGNLKKPRVRKLAVKFGLHNAAKKDSQGICFLGQVSLPDFLKTYIKPKVGAIVNQEGEVVGRHHGAYAYTIGQRHGLKISDKRPVTGDKGNTKPYYVSAKDVKRNIVVVAEGDSDALLTKEIKLVSLNLFTKKLPKTVFARVRYRQPVVKAKILKLVSGHLSLKFDRPVKFVAEGQSAVFYDAKGVMLGGGVIK